MEKLPTYEEWRAKVEAGHRDALASGELETHPLEGEDDDAWRTHYDGLCRLVAAFAELGL